MLAKTITTIVVAAAAVMAWPVADGNGIAKRDSHHGGGGHGNSTSGSCQPPQYKDSFRPKHTYKYDVGTGAIDCHSPYGQVYKSTGNNGHDYTALLTFEYPPDAAGKTCQFGFNLVATDVLTGDKERLIDLYSSLSPAPGCTASWPPGNQRNQHMARLKPYRPGSATYQAQYISYLTKPGPCKPAGTVEAYELVGVYDNVEVKWSPTVSGPYIAYW